MLRTAIALALIAVAAPVDSLMADDESEPSRPTRLSPYVSLNYSEWDEGVNFPFGAHADIGGGFSLQPMYDGSTTMTIPRGWRFASRRSPRRS